MVSLRRSSCQPLRSPLTGGRLVRLRANRPIRTTTNPPSGSRSSIMSHSHAWLIAATILLIGFAPVAPADSERKLEDDEQQLRRADLPVDGPALLDFLRKRTLTEADREAIQKM